MPEFLLQIIVGQKPNVLAMGVGCVCLDIFSLSHITSLLFLPLSGRQLDIE